MINSYERNINNMSTISYIHQTYEGINKNNTINLPSITRENTTIKPGARIMQAQQLQFTSQTEEANSISLFDQKNSIKLIFGGPIFPIFIISGNIGSSNDIWKNYDILKIENRVVAIPAKIEYKKALYDKILNDMMTNNLEIKRSIIKYSQYYKSFTERGRLGNNISDNLNEEAKLAQNLHVFAQFEQNSDSSTAKHSQRNSKYEKSSSVPAKQIKSKLESSLLHCRNPQISPKMNLIDEGSLGVKGIYNNFHTIPTSSGSIIQQSNGPIKPDIFINNGKYDELCRHMSNIGDDIFYSTKMSSSIFNQIKARLSIDNEKDLTADMLKNSLNGSHTHSNNDEQRNLINSNFLEDLLDMKKRQYEAKEKQPQDIWNLPLILNEKKPNLSGNGNRIILYKSLESPKLQVN